MENKNLENGSSLTFEDFAHENGEKYWLASEFLRFLGYKDLQSGINAIFKARQTCLTLHIEPDDNIKRIDDGGISKYSDYKLNRFACYLVAINASNKLENVAKAQAYFAYQAEQINIALETTNEIERLEIREEIKNKHKILNSTAKIAGVENFGVFTDAGYRGLYNKGLMSLKQYKGLSQKDDLFQYMGRTELAANLFRITQTEEKLKKDNVQTEKDAIETHRAVGSKIRAIYKENTGHFPEESLLEKNLDEVKKSIKITKKELVKIDKPQKNKK
jgi:DNA-damage-inducible protein D